MRLLGLIGGMSWESSASYYRLLNETTKARLGGLHSARLLLYSVDFHDIEALQKAGDWVRAGQLLAAAAQSLQRAGAEGLLLCTNTMHKVAADIEQAVALPLLHIADPTARALRAAGHRRVALLGTRFTMEETFYRQRLEAGHGLEVLIPEAAQRALIHRVIYEELCLGKVREDSRKAYLGIIDGLRSQGAQAVILGCTEIAMLLGPEHTTVPLFDTTRLHAEAAVDWALADGTAAGASP